MFRSVSCRWLVGSCRGLRLIISCVSLLLLLIAGSDVSRGGVHFLLLPDGLSELPPVAGPAGLIRPCGRAPHAGRRQEAEAGGVWQRGRRLPEL